MLEKKRKLELLEHELTFHTCLVFVFKGFVDSVKRNAAARLWKESGKKLQNSGNVIFGLL